MHRLSMTYLLHCRYLTDPGTGESYRVRLCPLERRAGVGAYRHLRAVVFETVRGEWAGSVPVPRSTGFEWLTRGEFAHLLGQTDC